MSDPAPREIRFVCTYPGARTPEGDALLKRHAFLAGHGHPEPTEDERVHQDQVIFRRPFRGVIEYTCQACGIRWRIE